jgi:hypothetical protein
MSMANAKSPLVAIRGDFYMATDSQVRRQSPTDLDYEGAIPSLARAASVPSSPTAGSLRRPRIGEVLPIAGHDGRP